MAGHARDDLERFTSDSHVDVGSSRIERRAGAAAPPALRRRRRTRSVNRHSGSTPASNNRGPRPAGTAFRRWGARAAAAHAASHRPLAARSSRARTSAAARAARLHFGACRSCGPTCGRPGTLVGARVAAIDGHAVESGRAGRATSRLIASRHPSRGVAQRQAAKGCQDRSCVSPAPPAEKSSAELLRLWTYQQAPAAPWSGAAVHAGPHPHRAFSY